MNGLLPFERTIEQTTRAMLPSPKTITAAKNEENYKLTRAATILVYHWLYSVNLLVVRRYPLVDDFC